MGLLARHFNRMVHELRQRKLMRDLFSRFVSKEVCENLLQDLVDQATQAISNAHPFEDDGRRLYHTRAGRNIDIAITGSRDLRMTLTILLEQVTTQLNVDAADALLLNSHTQNLDYAAGRGFRTDAIAETRRCLGEGNAGQAH